MQQGRTYIRPLGEDIWRRALDLRRASGVLRHVLIQGHLASIAASRWRTTPKPWRKVSDTAAAARPLKEALLVHHGRITLDGENAGRFLLGLRRPWSLVDTPAVCPWFGQQPHAPLVGHIAGGAGARQAPESAGNSTNPENTRSQTSGMEKPYAKTNPQHRHPLPTWTTARPPWWAKLHNRVLRRARKRSWTRWMDNNAIERERGITILAKNVP